MSELSLRPYLQMKGGTEEGHRVRACFGADAISLRALLSSFSRPISEKWKSLGPDRDRLGKAVGDSRSLAVGNIRVTVQRFEHGTITDLGDGTVSAALDGGGAGGGASLPETPYVLTLEKVDCISRTQGEIGEDELWDRLILVTDASLGEEGEIVKQADFRSDHVNPGQTIPVNSFLYEGSLPEVWQLARMAIEVDLDADAQSVMSNFSQKMREAGMLSFGKESNEIGVIVGLLVVFAGPIPWLGMAGWFLADMITADQITYLGEKLQAWSRGGLPAEHQGFIPVKDYAQERLRVHVSYSTYENGDIREQRRYTGADASVDYVFTFRHFLGNGGGATPKQPAKLSVEQGFHYIHNPNSGKSHFGHSTNRLSWEDVEGAIGYIVERSVNGKPFVKAKSARVHPPGITGGSYMDAYLQQEGEVIRYRVTAYNRAGFSPYSEILAVTLPVPSAPYGLSASIMPGVSGPGVFSIHVFWMVQSLGDYGYILERSRNGGNFIQAAAVAAHNPSTQGANHVDVVAGSRQGERIQYRVKGYNDFGEGAYSEVLEVTV